MLIGSDVTTAAIDDWIYIYLRGL